MATPAQAFEYTSRNSIDISKMMQGARLLAMSFTWASAISTDQRQG